MSRPLVLCATDLTDEGIRAVDLGLATARALEGDLAILHTCDPIPDEEAVPASVAPGVTALRERLVERRAEAERKLGEERDRCAAHGVNVATALVDGPPAEAILREADRRKPSIIVLGRRHREEGFVGKTIDHVVRHAPCPVFVAPPDGPAPKDLTAARWLVGVDFSPRSLHAIHATKKFVERCGGDMTVLHIVQPAGGEDREYADRSPAQLLREEGLREEDVKLHELVAREAPGAKVEQLRTIERPSDELCRIAKERDATALVVGTHGRSGIARLFLGSTAERLLRHAERPVLIVREAAHEGPFYVESTTPPRRIGPNRVLVAVDFSEPSRRALELARALAAKLRIAVEAVHVFDSPLDVRRGLAGTVDDAASAPPVPDDARSALVKKLDALVAEVFGPDVSTVRTHVLAGRIVPTLLRVSGEREADLLVVGTTGKTGMQRLLLGSVAEKLVRESSVPVLTVH